MNRGTLALMAIIGIAIIALPVASASTWVTTTQVNGELVPPHWTTTSEINGTLHNKLFTNITNAEIDVRGQSSSGMNIIGPIWVIITLPIPVILGYFLGRSGFLIGAVGVMVVLSIASPAYWWVAILVVVHAGVIAWRGGVQ